MAKYKDHLKGSLAVALDEAALAPSQSAALALIQGWADVELCDRRVRVDDEMEARIQKLSADGKAAHSIGMLLGLSAPTVRKILKKVARAA